MKDCDKMANSNPQPIIIAAPLQKIRIAAPYLQQLETLPSSQALFSILETKIKLMFTPIHQRIMALWAIFVYLKGRNYQKDSYDKALCVTHDIRLQYNTYLHQYSSFFYHIHYAQINISSNIFPFNSKDGYVSIANSIILSSMQINLDLYIRNFRIFYQQLTKGHTKQQQLNKLFKGLIESELRKWRKGYGPSKISETSSDNPLLNKLRENRKNKEQTKLNIQPYYASEKVQNCVVFGYMYLVLEQRNLDAFQFLQDHLKDHFVDRQTYSTAVLRKMNYIWNKFDDIVSGKRKVVRFQKQLQEYFKELPQVFLDLIYKIIIQDKILVIENKQIYFQKLSQFLTLKIEYFEVNEQHNLKTYIYGQKQKYSLKIGYLKGQNHYVNVGKLPDKQEKQLSKQITLDKFDEISKTLNEMYSMNMKEYLNLSNLKYKAQNSSTLGSQRPLTTSRERDEASLDNHNEYISI